MKEFIKNKLREGLFDAYNDISDNDYKNAYIKKINTNFNNLLLKVSNNPNFAFILGKNMKFEDYGESNRCETNTFNYIKEKLINGETNYLPVGGFFFTPQSLTPVEHWWVFNSETNQHIEVSPMDKEKPWAYGGIINKDINENILKAENVFDVDFFKGGNVYHWYFK